MRKGRNGGTLKTGGNNGGGRPRKLPGLDEMLADIMGDEKDGISAAEAILRKLRQMAINGNLRAAEILLERSYGKVKQPVEHSGKDGGAIETKTIVINIPPDDGGK